MNLQRAIAKLQTSKMRRLLAPVEDRLRPLLLRRGLILSGPLKGLRFPGGERGTVLGTYEQEVQQALAEHLAEGHVFYDIGANRGYFSLLGTRKVGTTGHVYAFEPLPDNQVALRQIMALNQIVHYTLVPAAVSDAVGEATFWLGDGDAGRASLVPWKGSRHMTIPTTTLDAFVEEHRWPDVIKLDVEGAEGRVLAGAGTLLASEKPICWIIEIHDEENERAVLQALQAHRYQVRTLMRAESSKYARPYILAWRQA